MLRQTRHPFLAVVLALALAVLPIASASAAPFTYDFGASAVDTADSDGGLFSWFVSLFEALVGGAGAPSDTPAASGSDTSGFTTDSEEPTRDWGPQIDVNGSK